MKPGATVGETIRLIREKRGLSQEDVSQDTRLSMSVIRLIEQDRFAELPEGIYTRNFIRTLAEYLDLDFAAIWAQLQEGRQIEVVRGKDGEDPSIWREESVPETRVRAWRPGKLFWTVFLILVLVGALLALWRLGVFENLRGGAPTPTSESPSAAASDSTPISSPATTVENAGTEELNENLLPAPATIDEDADRGGDDSAEREQAESQATNGHPTIRINDFELPPVFIAGISSSADISDLPDREGDASHFARLLQQAALLLEIEALGRCSVQINVDDRRHVARLFGEGGGRWRVEGQDFFIVSAEGAGNLRLRFNGDDYPLPASGDGRLMAFRLDTRGVLPGN